MVLHSTATKNSCVEGGVGAVFSRKLYFAFQVNSNTDASYTNFDTKGYRNSQWIDGNAS